MIKDYKAVQEFEDREKASSPVDSRRSFAIANALYEQARRMGVFPLADPLDGIEVDINLSARLRRVRRVT